MEILKKKIAEEVIQFSHNKCLANVEVVLRQGYLSDEQREEL